MIMELSNLISAAVAEKMTPDFIEKEVNTRVAKLIEESVDRALRRYSDTGKLVTEAVEAALRVDRIDLPSYGLTVAAILKAQIEARVSELVAGKLSADMEELLSLAPKEIKLSTIADEMRERHDGDAYGPIITVIVERNEYGSTWLYLDEDECHEARDKYRCDYRLLVGSDGKIASATLKEADIKSGRHVGRAYGLEQKIRAYYACGTTIIIDEDNVVTSVGDY
jgi:hypothetical protein